MNILKKFLRYSHFSSGDFENIFKNFDVPPCPQIVLTLIREIRNPDIGIDQIVSILESDPVLASQKLKIVNSALNGLPGQVTSIGKAVSILGLNEIENIAFGYAMTKTVRDPGIQDFDIACYWTDSILRAVFSRKAAEAMDTESEEAFSAGLLQDIALPVLLSQWSDLYCRVFQQWKDTHRDLHIIEDEVLSWNHCQAGAWIAKSWGLPDLFVCCMAFTHPP